MFVSTNSWMLFWTFHSFHLEAFTLEYGKHLHLNLKALHYLLFQSPMVSSYSQAGFLLVHPTLFIAFFIVFIDKLTLCMV